MREQRKGGGVQPGELRSKALICVLVFMYGSGDIGFVLTQGRVLSIGSRLFLLEGLGAALVSLVVNL